MKRTGPQRNVEGMTLRLHPFPDSYLDSGKCGHSVVKQTQPAKSSNRPPRKSSSELCLSAQINSRTILFNTGERNGPGTNHTALVCNCSFFPVEKVSCSRNQFKQFPLLKAYLLLSSLTLICEKDHMYTGSLVAYHHISF